MHVLSPEMVEILSVHPDPPGGMQIGVFAPSQRSELDVLRQCQIRTDIGAVEPRGVGGLDRARRELIVVLNLGARITCNGAVV